MSSPAMEAKTIALKMDAALSSGALRVSGDSASLAGAKTRRQYRMPPSRVAMDERCSQRMIMERMSGGIWLSIQSAYDPRDTAGGNAALQLLGIRRRTEPASAGGGSGGRD